MKLSIGMFTMLAAGIFTCCSANPPQARAAEAWGDVATAQRQSPAEGTSASIAWQGADGKPASVAVDAPQLAPQATVVALRPTAGDNGPAIAAALAKLRAAGGAICGLRPGAIRSRARLRR